jgi:hypothetical protein
VRPDALVRTSPEAHLDLLADHDGSPEVFVGASQPWREAFTQILQASASARDSTQLNVGLVHQ